MGIFHRSPECSWVATASLFVFVFVFPFVTTSLLLAQVLAALRLEIGKQNEHDGGCGRSSPAVEVRQGETNL